MSHTELPWTLHNSRPTLIGSGDRAVANTFFPETTNCQIDNAEFIVKVVNSHYQLLEIAKAVSNGNFNQSELISQAREAIKQAEE